MSRFNRKNVVAARTATGPLTTVATPAGTRTHQGGPGFLRDDKSELFLLAATSLDITADTFYEGGNARVARFVELIGQVAVADPDWTFEFLRWLRGPGNIRTAAIVGAVEASLAMLAADITGSRAIISAVCQRPDEPGELLAYLLSRHGRKIPKPIKRGLADAAGELYSQRSLLKYDTGSHGVRFADVIDLVRPWPKNAETSALFKCAIDRRHNRPVGLVPPGTLPMLIDNYAVRAEVAEGHYDALLSPSALHSAGMTWEDALSLGGKNVDKAALWRAMIPSMGYMALLRNLRNFDQAGLSDADVAPVIAKLTDPEEVRKSRQFPMRFLSAYRAVDNLRWSYPLEQALDLSLANVPVLKGRTLILIDTSGSMHHQFGPRSDLRRWDAAVVFGLALARRAEHADVVSFSSSTAVFPTRPGESLLAAVTRWKNDGFFLNHGTSTAAAVQAHFSGHDRVVILTDEQAGRLYGWNSVDPGSVMPQDRMLWTFNLAGYEAAQVAASPTRVTVGGLTDQMFGLIPSVEAGVQGSWPWESA